jgi:hypothetical protein
MIDRAIGSTDREQLLETQQEVTVAEQEAEMAKQQKEDAEQRAAWLAAKLRELGIEPD